MANYPELKLPEAWKPLFRKLDSKGWGLELVLPQAEWASRPTLVFSDEGGEKRYLSFLNEPIWCGNTRQPAGLTIAAFSKNLPTTREVAESHPLPLSGDWEAHLDQWLTESLI